ncbi:MAG: ABC transporter ATP-binding protein, partial [Clostridia bacterium]|nr:ABC transporter ATP-binding protein [Clostridia bacterium]
IKKIRADKHITIIISSHILGELSKTADKFLFLNDGKIVANIDNGDGVDVEKLYVEKIERVKR